MVLQYLPFLFLIRVGCLLAAPPAISDPDVERISAILSDLRAQLQMSQEIRVSIVPTNSRMVSVERMRAKAGDGEWFLISFDQQFLASLDQDELRTAIAHELGHVWIFSHHPYLQTEALANEIAMRVVDRESLKKIYSKLWAHLGVSGKLEEFLGEEKIHSASSVPPR